MTPSTFTAPAGKRLVTRSIVQLSFAFIITLAAAGYALGIDIHTVALSDEGAPGTGDNFVVFEAPILNANGQAAFFAELDDDFATSGMWSEGSGSLAKVALQGEVAPDTGGSFFDGFSGLNFYINDAGQTAFVQSFDDLAVVGAFSETGAGNALRKIAGGGDTAPGANNALSVFDDAFGTLGGFNDNGLSTFRAFMSPSGSGIWAEGSLNKIAEVGDAAPGEGGDLFDAFNTPANNNGGFVAFSADTGGGTHQGVWTNTSGALARLAGEGDAADGGGTYSIFFGPTVSLNENNDIAFGATLVGGSVPDGIWVARNSTIEKVAVEGDTAPDAGGATFSTGAQGIELDTIGLDASSNAAFRATLSDSRLGLFSEGLGGLHAVAITGDTAPDSGGETFDSIVHWSMNDLGQTALLAGITDFTEVIYAEDIFGNLLRIVGPGDMLEVAPGDFREVEFLNFYGLDGSIGSIGNNVSSGFNADGELAFWASFTDETEGVFVTTVPIPEPASFFLLAVGGLLLAIIAKRRH